MRMYEAQRDSFMSSYSFTSLSASEQRHFKGDMNELCAWLVESVTTANKSRIITEYEEFLNSKKLKQKTIDNKLSHADIFLSAIIEKEIQINMFDDNETTTEQVTTPEQSEAVSTPETTETATQNKAGRKRKDASGKLSNKKIMLYVTDDLHSEITAIADSLNTSISQILLSLLENYINRVKKSSKVNELIEQKKHTALLEKEVTRELQELQKFLNTQDN